MIVKPRLVILHIPRQQQMAAAAAVAPAIALGLRSPSQYLVSLSVKMRRQFGMAVGPDVSRWALLLRELPLSPRIIQPCSPEAYRDSMRWFLCCKVVQIRGITK